MEALCSRTVCPVLNPPLAGLDLTFVYKDLDLELVDLNLGPLDLDFDCLDLTTSLMCAPKCTTYELGMCITADESNNVKDNDIN